MFSNRYEVRFGEVETRHLMSTAGAVKLTPDLTFFARNRFNLSQPELAKNQLDADGLMGLAYRPMDGDRLNWLGRLEAVRGERLPGGGNAAAAAPTARGLRAVVEVNYQPASRVHLLGRYASRFARDTFEGASLRSYTEVWEGRLMVDLARRVTAGIAGRLLRQPSSATSMTGLGLESGFMVAPDLWLVGGYTVTGFSDSRFPDGNRRSRGPFLSLRFKFDERLIRSLTRGGRAQAESEHAAGTSEADAGENESRDAEGGL